MLNKSMKLKKCICSRNTRLSFKNIVGARARVGGAAEVRGRRGKRSSHEHGDVWGGLGCGEHGATGCRGQRHPGYQWQQGGLRPPHHRSQAQQIRSQVNGSFIFRPLYIKFALKATEIVEIFCWSVVMNNVFFFKFFIVSQTEPFIFYWQS